MQEYLIYLSQNLFDITNNYNTCTTYQNNKVHSRLLSVTKYMFRQFMLNVIIF